MGRDGSEHRSGFRFATVALAKTRDRSRFVQSIEQYRVVPSVLARPLATVIIGVELGLALGLLVPTYRSFAAALESRSSRCL